MLLSIQNRKLVRMSKNNIPNVQLEGSGDGPGARDKMRFPAASPGPFFAGGPLQRAGVPVGHGAPPPPPGSPSFFAPSMATNGPTAPGTLPLKGQPLGPSTRANPQSTADRVLLLMIFDFLRRAGLPNTANQLLSEARVDFYSAETATAMGMMEMAAQLHGRNPQPGGVDGGFLKDWWSTFWQMYQSRITTGFKRSPPTSLSPSSPDATTESQAAMQMQMKMAFEARRRLILSAMKALGLGGRDPQTLTPEEQQLVTRMIQKQLSPTGPPSMPPPEMETTAPKTKHARMMETMHLRPVSHSPPVLGSGRPILPAAPMSPSTAPAPLSKTPKASSSNQQADNELDETALLSFFGTPADWLATDRLFVPPSHSPPPEIYAASTNQEATIITSGSPLDTSALKIDQFYDSGHDAPRPGTSDDLLLAPDCIRRPVKDFGSVLALQEICELGQHQAKAVSTSISTDSLFLASGGHDKRILIFSLLHGQGILARVLEGYHAQQITHVRFSSDKSRRWFASSSFDQTVHIWDLGAVGDPNLPSSLDSGPTYVLRNVHDEPIWSIDFIPSASVAAPLQLASIDASGKLVLWELPAFEEDNECKAAPRVVHTTTIKSGDDHNVTVRQIKARPSPSLARSALLAIANGSRIELFDCDRLESIEALSIPSSRPDHKAKAVVAINWGDLSLPDMLIAATSDSVAIWDLSSLLNGTAYTTRPPPSPSLSASASSGSGSFNGSTTPRVVASAVIPADKLTCCTLVRDSSYAILGGYQCIYLWHYHQSTGPQPPLRRPLKFSAHDGLVVSLSVCRAGPLRVASASHDGKVKLWTVLNSESPH